MAKGKGRCPGCGSEMKLKHRFCTSCGRRNPLLVAPRTRAGTAAAKSAGAYAPVIRGPFRESPLAAEIYGRQAFDPDAREHVAADITKAARAWSGPYGGSAA